MKKYRKALLTLSLSAVLLATQPAPARADVFSDLLGAFTQFYTSYFQGMWNYAVSRIQSLVPLSLGIPNINAARTDAKPSSYYEGNNAEYVVAEGAVDGLLGSAGQDATKSEISLTDSSLSAGLTASTQVTTIANSAQAKTATQDILKDIALQNAELSKQFGEQSKVIAASHKADLLAEKHRAIDTKMLVNIAKESDKTNMIEFANKDGTAGQLLMIESQMKLY